MQYKQSLLGPGSYECEINNTSKYVEPGCAAVYRHLSVGKEEAKSGNYHYEGSRLIYEQHYKDPRKLGGKKNSVASINSKLENMMSSIREMTEQNHY